MPGHTNPPTLPPSTADLARSITHQASRQTYYTIGWLVDRGLTDDAYRAYAYFRWVDDTIDGTSKDRRAQLAFVARQRQLLQRLQAGAATDGLSPQELQLADLLRARQDDHPGLCSYLTNMMAVMEFDAARRGRLITAEELERCTTQLSAAIMDALAYFIGHRHKYPTGGARHQAVRGAHIAHMLRDTHADLEAGYFNIPRQVLEAHRIAPTDIAHPAYRSWVRQRVELARRCFQDGKRHIRSMGNPRSQIAGYLYCTRFEVVLRCIEMDRYLLRSKYPGLPGLPMWLLAFVPAPRPVLGVSKHTPAGNIR